MRKFIQIVLVLLFFSLSVSAGGLRNSANAENSKQTVELIINGDKYLLQDVSPDGYIDIYSIIGSKVKTIEVKSGVCDPSTTLPTGYYIVKINESTRKIAVK